MPEGVEIVISTRDYGIFYVRDLADLDFAKKFIEFVEDKLKKREQAKLLETREEKAEE